MKNEKRETATRGKERMRRVDRVMAKGLDDILNALESWLGYRIAARIDMILQASESESHPPLRAPLHLPADC